MSIVPTSTAKDCNLSDAKYFYDDELKRQRDRVIRAMQEAEHALDCFTRLELEVTQMFPAVKVRRDDAQLDDAAKALTTQLQSFYFGESA